MIASERKPLDEILGYLDGEKKVFLVACDGCSAGCKVSDPEHTAEMVREMEANGKTVTGVARVEMTCNAGLSALMLMQHLTQVNEADSILVLACGDGIQAVAAAAEKPVHPGTNSLYFGGFQGLWRSEPKCAECGNCMLDYTGGICPYTACSKSLLYGSCGGPKDGNCEVDASVPCGWMRIYDRLSALGKAERLKAMPPLRNFKNMLPMKDRRRSSIYSLEYIETEPAASESNAG